MNNTYNDFVYQKNYTHKNLLKRYITDVHNTYNKTTKTISNTINNNVIRKNYNNEEHYTLKKSVKNITNNNQYTIHKEFYNDNTSIIRRNINNNTYNNTYNVDKYFRNTYVEHLFQRKYDVKNLMKIFCNDSLTTYNKIIKQANDKRKLFINYFTDFVYIKRIDNDFQSQLNALNARTTALEG